MHSLNHLAFVCTAILLSSFTSSRAQNATVAEFTVHAGKYDRLNTPISVNLNTLDLPEDTSHWQLRLVERRGKKTIPVAMQWASGDQDFLLWRLEGDTPAGSTRRYTLQSIEQADPLPPAVTINDQDSAVTFSINNQAVLTYQYALATMPPGVDDIYRRGGFIHPLRSLGGGVLTRIQPPDHYHHYGIWNPWTHTEYEGRSLDFWNLAKGQGTILAKGVTSLTEGPVMAHLTAWHEHVAYPDSTDRSKRETLLNELWDLRVWNTTPEQPTYLVDFTSTLSNATDQPFTIKAYRYQGFGFRANKDWNDRTARLLTSAGMNKANGNGTRARWVAVQGPTEAGTSGVVFMTHPANVNFPEQIRIWPEGMNEGQENVFFNFNPAQEQDWVLKPHQTYALKYRMLVYDGAIDTAAAQRYWQDFAYPPQVEVNFPSSLTGKKILVYTKNGEGYVHDNIPASVQALRKLADENGFDMVVSDDPSLFTPDQLKQFDALIFSNTNNDIFDTPKQEAAFQQYIRSGGGFVAIHSASGSERDWPWFWKNLGGKFVRHPPLQDFDVQVIDKNHPSTVFLPDTWSIKQDECYYLNHLNPNIRVLVAADLTTVEDERKNEYPGDTFGNLFPTTWCHTTDGGRQWYTSLGHRPEHYSDPVLMKHILGGIQWVLQ